MSTRRTSRTTKAQKEGASDILSISSPVSDKPLISTSDITATAKRALRTKIKVDPSIDASIFEEQASENDDDDDFVIDNNDNGDTNGDDISFSEVEELVQKTPASKKRRITKNSIPTNKKPKSSINAMQNKNNRVVRGFKDLTSQRAKLGRLFGNNEEKLLTLAKAKEAFEGSAFSFPTENVQKGSKYYLDYKPLCSVQSDTSVEELTNIFGVSKNHTKYIQLTEPEMFEKFNYSKDKLGVIIGEVQHFLNVGDKLEFPVFNNNNRKGFVYNAGGLVTDMAWLTNENLDSSEQYLAVSISKIHKNPSDKRLMLFEKECHYSSIEIFKLHTISLKFDKVQTIIHNFGETWNLKWHEGFNEVSTSNDYIGLLGFCCQEGSVKLIEINRNENLIITELESPSFSFSIPEYLITSFDFLSPTAIVCGFNSGHLAEFVLSETDLPSYFIKVTESYIVNISVGYSKFENPVIATISIDGNMHIFDPKDIFSSKCTLNRFKGDISLPLTYLPNLYAFIYSDSGNSTKFITPKAQFPLQISSLDANVTSFGSSRLHPFILSAGSDGIIQIDNVARKIFDSLKKTNSHKTLRLWKWDYSKRDNLYKLNHHYEAKKMVSNEVFNCKLNPHGINITTVKWNENRAGCKFYAFANAAGFLTFEELE
ncbi:hypothetical protein TPHA_0H01740 [Tetrapisispora phaffii CBS 4417]|uniref:Transcription factor tau subunit n=1 Tax=Tetrapisispora phaffii (strain ATCC 24235 / CBS 4417 / NBRC 1672 / NRRL Y-8282 / UCD 70-5) TaxID=1071381 RepID=G8BX76_TETPH|nr:hypothetical protein TPHA_0H01740 [Tetrapisispora phaffii CBS 4417]CCE64380.1 hypothetical protein TPHA_0H01740 [Tetrapisispora phaffii CBS 4417]